MTPTAATDLMNAYRVILLSAEGHILAPASYVGAPDLTCLPGILELKAFIHTHVGHPAYRLTDDYEIVAELVTGYEVRQGHRDLTAETVAWLA